MSHFIQPETIFINLYSKDAIQRSDDGTLSNVTFYLNNVVKDQDENSLINVWIESAQFPKSFYNINTNNNILNILVNSTSYIVTIEEGNYNELTLLAELKSKLLAITGLTFSIVYSKINGRLTFSTTANFTFLNSSIFGVIGFSLGNFSSTNFILKTTYPLSLLGTRVLKICSRSLNTSNIDSKNNTNILFNLPVTCNNFELIQYSNQSSSYSVMNNRILNAIDIFVVNDNGELVNFNGIHWSVTLGITLNKKLIMDQQNTSFRDTVNNQPPQSNKSGVIDNSFYDDDLEFLLYQNGIYI